MCLLLHDDQALMAVDAQLSFLAERTLSNFAYISNLCFKNRNLKNAYTVHLRDQNPWPNSVPDSLRNSNQPRTLRCYHNRGKTLHGSRWSRIVQNSADNNPNLAGG